MIVSRNWLKEYIGDTTPGGQELADMLTAHAFEVESIEEKDGDALIDVDILPNRASDCLCQRGVAREVASITGRALVNDPLAQTPTLSENGDIEITIENAEDCPRFSLSLMSSVSVSESPTWLKERLASLGVRSINNLVDATNYVMYAIGQPTHVYDADKFPKNANDKYGFVIRRAKEGEKVSLLGEGGKSEDRTLELQGGELLVVNEADDVAVGLAGVKGGRFAEVTDQTTRILIEAAHFHPTLTRQTARRNGIVIDASKRFENEPARQLPAYAQAELVKLITEIAGGVYEGTCDEFPLPKENPRVSVRTEKVNTLLGVTIETAVMQQLLEQAGVYVEEEGSVLQCTGPFERTDLIIEEDFIEEIGRLYGYDKVQSVVPDTVPLAEINQRHYYSERVRELLLAQGFSEIITSSFCKKDTLCLQNALASDKGCLRSSLTKNIYEALDKNAGFADQLGTADTRVFEIGTVFTAENGDVSEHTALALGVRLRPSGYSGKEDKVLQTILDSFEKEFGVELSWKIEKGVAEIDFDTLIKELPAATAYQEAPPAAAVIYQPFSLYPAISRDIAMWVGGETTVEEVDALLRQEAGELCVRLTHVDSFEKDGRTSLAFRLVFQSHKKTLTDSEVHDIMDVVYAAVSERKWEVR